MAPSISALCKTLLHITTHVCPLWTYHTIRGSSPAMHRLGYQRPSVLLIFSPPHFGCLVLSIDDLTFPASLSFAENPLTFLFIHFVTNCPTSPLPRSSLVRFHSDTEILAICDSYTATQRRNPWRGPKFSGENPSAPLPPHSLRTNTSVKPFCSVVMICWSLKSPFSIDRCEVCCFVLKKRLNLQLALHLVVIQKFPVK